MATIQICEGVRGKLGVAGEVLPPGQGGSLSLALILQDFRNCTRGVPFPPGQGGSLSKAVNTAIFYNCS